MMTERGTREGPGAAREAGGGRQRHIPVLLREVVEQLRPGAGETFIDATFGAGGYTRAILEAAGCRVLAIDRDPTAIAGGAPLKQEFGERVTLIEGRFGGLDDLARSAGIEAVDGVVLDLGVSSMQLDQAERGFSFQADGPLDMRMSGSGPRAADLIATLEEKEIADILFQLGDERRSRAIAKSIVRARTEKPIETTRDLVTVVGRVLGTRPIDGKHPATRTFQALRLAVNDELGELVSALGAAERLLRTGGRLVVVSFHSLEDRIVKRFLAERSGRSGRLSRHVPATDPIREPSFRVVNHRPITPGSEEISANPRARSAKLRAAERTPSPPWPLDKHALGVPGIALDV